MFCRDVPAGADAVSEGFYGSDGERHGECLLFLALPPSGITLTSIRGMFCRDVSAGADAVSEGPDGSDGERHGKPLWWYRSVMFPDYLSVGK